MLTFGQETLDEGLNSSSDHLALMPCFYPEGTPEQWCERHAKDHAMLLQLKSTPVRAPMAA